MRISLVLFAILFAAFSVSEGQEVTEFDTPDPTDDGMRTGVEIGASIPSFEAVDAEGKTWDFERIKGPRGAFLLFYRSADW